MPGKNRAKLPPPGQSTADTPPPVPARRAPPAVPQTTYQEVEEETEGIDEENYIEPSTALNQTPDTEDFYDEFEEVDEDPKPVSVQRPAPRTRVQKLPDPPQSQANDPEETYDEFEVETGMPDDEHGIEEEQVYESCDDDTSPQLPPIPAMNMRGKRALPQVPPLPPVIQAAYEDEGDLLYEATEDQEEDDDVPPPPPPTTNRPPISHHQPKTPVKKVSDSGPTQLGIGAGDILAARGKLRRVDKTVEEKNEKNKQNEVEKTLFSHLKSKLKSPGSQDSGVIVVTPNKENDRPRPTTPAQDTPKRELPPPPLTTSTPTPPPVKPAHKEQPRPVSQEFPPPPSPLDYPTPESPEDIYDDAASFEDELLVHEWYRGEINRDAGAKLVEKVGKDGTFLVRKSTQGKDQPYTLVVLFRGRVNNLKVRFRRDNKYALGEAKENEITFTNIPGMVKHHMVHPVLLMSAQKGEITLQETPKK